MKSSNSGQFSSFCVDKDDTSMLLDMCHDMKSGMSYRNGEKWHVDDCISCSCVNGRALCIAASCLSTCSNPVYVEGKCCPVCKNNESEGSIFVMLKYLDNTISNVN